MRKRLPRRAGGRYPPPGSALAGDGDLSRKAAPARRPRSPGATDVVVLTQTGIRSAEERLRTWAALSPAGS
ncbi:hypothetical protein AB0M80_13790 [Amycolatopsis sp. NPDC051045]|uniref:hypothetical protein n=1 Tax=Amycolatopsis sp. NPDC051045 TaxID=3156922 RepID=UPI0034274998